MESVTAPISPHAQPWVSPDELKPARNLLDSFAVRKFTTRSDLRGGLQFASHLACASATGLPDRILLVSGFARDGTAWGDVGDDVRPDARMRPSDRLRIAQSKRNRRLDCWCAEFL